MTTEGSSAPSVPEAAGGPLPIANFKALLKDSLSEVLRENPSLLQPRGETQRGELAASVGEGGKVIYRLCPGVVSEAKWRGCSVLGVATVAGERHRILSGCSAGRGCHVGVGTAPGGGGGGDCRSLSLLFISYSLPLPLSLPLSLSSLSSLSPPLSNGGAGATLGEMPDGGVVEGLGLPVISPSEGVLGVPVVLSAPGMGETVEGPLVSHAKSGEGGAGEETTLRAKGGEKTVEAPPQALSAQRGPSTSPRQAGWPYLEGRIHRHGGAATGQSRGTAEGWMAGDAIVVGSRPQSPASGSARSPELGPVLWSLHHCCGEPVPRAGPEAAGIPDFDRPGGEVVRR